MKRTVLLFLVTVASLTMLCYDTFGQVSQLINYQAVARNTSSQLITNQNISVRISILSGSPTGTSEYSETHAVTTNQFGIFNIQIGGGTVVSGIFTQIGWSSADHFVKVEADENGGSNYQLLGTSQLVSVPYALYSDKAKTAEQYTEKDTMLWKKNGNNIFYNSGNVGIGTTSTTSKITIVGSSGSTLKITDGNQGANKILTSDANGNASWQTPATTPITGFSNMQVFATAGTFTFTAPSGITKVMVEVWGAGGGGGTGSTGGPSGGGGGGGGGYGKQILTVTPSTNYTVVVGTGGIAQGVGGNSSFGSTMISATGGSGGNGMWGGNGGTSTAIFEISGESIGYAWSRGLSGGAAFGSSGGKCGDNGITAGNGVSPGGGGGGGAGFTGYLTGGSGGTGRVVICW